MKPVWRRTIAALVSVPMLIGLASCSRADSGASGSTPQDQGPASEVRLAFFPNVTHASALIGLDQGLFEKELGSTKLTPTKFNAGPEEVSALLGGSVDIGFIGSGPAINAADKGKDAVKLISGATSGGAQLVVKPEINTPADLKGKTVDSPQQGNTQDVALKKWLAGNNLTSDVKVQNLDNALTLDEFKKGTIAGAWVPEPWASRLTLDGGGKVLVDEKSLWPNGKFPTTVIVVRTQFLQQHPATVQAVLRAVLAANDFVATNKPGAEEAVNRQLKALTGSSLSSVALGRAFDGITLTTDPLAADFPQLVKDSVTAGALKSEPKLTGYFDLTALNKVLTAQGKPAVDAAGLDSK